MVETTLEADLVPVREMFGRYFRCQPRTRRGHCCNPEKPLWVSFTVFVPGEVVDLGPPRGEPPQLETCEARTVRVFPVVEGGAG